MDIKNKCYSPQYIPFKIELYKEFLLSIVVFYRFFFVLVDQQIKNTNDKLCTFVSNL